MGSQHVFPPQRNFVNGLKPLSGARTWGKNDNRFKQLESNKRQENILNGLLFHASDSHGIDISFNFCKIKGARSSFEKIKIQAIFWMEKGRANWLKKGGNTKHTYVPVSITFWNIGNLLKTKRQASVWHLRNLHRSKTEACPLYWTSYPAFLLIAPYPASESAIKYAKLKGVRR